MLLEVPLCVIGLTGAVDLIRPVFRQHLTMRIVFDRIRPICRHTFKKLLLGLWMIPYVFSLQIGHLLPDLLRRLEIVTAGLEIEPGLSTICSQFLNVMPFCIVKLIERQLIDYLQREGHGADLIINLNTTFQMLLVSLVHGALGLTDILGAVLEGIQIDQAEAIRLDIGKRIYGGHIIIFRIHKTASMRDAQLNTLLPEDDELSVTAMIPRVLVDEIIIKIVRLGESLSIFFSTFCVIRDGD